MRTALAQTSLAAYRAIEPELSGKRREVMLAVWQYFPHSRFTRKQFAHVLGWEINRLTGRVLELIERNYLEEHGTTKQDGFTAALVRIKRGQQLGLFE